MLIICVCLFMASPLKGVRSMKMERICFLPCPTSRIVLASVSPTLSLQHRVENFSGFAFLVAAFLSAAFLGAGAALDLPMVDGWVEKHYSSCSLKLNKLNSKHSFKAFHTAIQTNHTNSL